MGNVLYIVNPAGHGGAGRAAWERFRELWGREIAPEDAVVTKRPGHAREIAATAEGFEILVAVGGDGTVGEVVSGIMDQPKPRPKLAIVPAGTGNDIGRNVGIRSIEEGVSALRGNRTRAVDLIRMERRAGDRTESHYGLLCAAIGFVAKNFSMHSRSR